MRVLDGQSILDVSVQESGSIEAAFEIAQANGLSLTDAPQAGQELTIPSVMDKDIATYFKNKGLKPSTAITTTDVAQTIADEGIEFWAIEVDFVIS